MVLERFLSGGTNCPKCGSVVCSVTGRLFKRHHNCPACGCPCTTPLWVYFAASSAGGAGVLLWFWANSPGYENAIFAGICAGFLAYVGAGSLLMALVPFNCREGTEWTAQERPLESVYSCPAQILYHAVQNALRRAGPYEVTEKDEQRQVLWVSKSGNAFTRNRWQAHEPSLHISLLVEDMGSGQSRLAMNIVPKLGGLERHHKERELNRINKLVQDELSHFYYSQGAKKG